MGDELDTSVDTSFDTSISDFSDSGGFGNSVDVGGVMDDPADVGGFSNDASAIERLRNAPSDVGSIMDDAAEFGNFADQPSDAVDTLDGSSDIEMLMDEPADLGPAADKLPAFTDYQPDVESIADAPSEIESLMDEPPDVASAMDDGGDVEPYHAVPNSDIPILQEELAQDTGGDFTNPSQNTDFTEHMQDEMLDVPQDIEAANQLTEGLEPADEAADIPQEIDYDEVYSGLDSYDFDGIDISSDVDRLDSSLESFQPETWENLSVDEQKAAMSDLADYVKDAIGFDKPPQIVYYNNPVEGDYGGYSPGTNTLEVNEYMLYDSGEAADTVAHELWHAYQHERALNPQSVKDYQYQYGFDNYIQPDVDFTAYQDQLVEAEARAFAQQFKDRLSMKGRGI